MVADRILADVLDAFCRDLACCSVKPLGSGNINDTYLVHSAGRSFVLQKINSNVFRQPQRVIDNFQKVTAHLINKQKRGEGQLQVAEPVLTKDKQLSYRDESGSLWRAQSYIAHTSRPVLSSGQQAYHVGQILAVFHRLIADLDLHGFYDPLPGFHHLPQYLQQYDEELYERGIGPGAEKELDVCLAAVERYRVQAATLEKAKGAGILSLQPIHGDPKVDNFIFDELGHGVGLLDLDTVAMGLVHYDLGDCLRSCCNRAGETAKNTDPAAFDLGLCRALLDGYFSGPAPLLTLEQRGYIFDALVLICYELGLRFFTDHLRGNPYFKVQRDGDNLTRALTQFSLVDAVGAQEKHIRAMVLTAGH